MSEAKRELELQTMRWADNPEPDFSEEGEPREIAECQCCGRVLKDSDESLAFVSNDGEVLHWCCYCISDGRHFPERLVTDILEAAGIFYATGWADETQDACEGAADRQKRAGVPAKKVIVIQKGVSA